MVKFRKGKNFISENTGSATKINLDGKWEFDFVDDNSPSRHDTTRRNMVKPKSKK